MVRENVRALQGDMEQRLTPSVIAHIASISACEKGVKPERALELIEAMRKHQLTPDLITFSASISVCEKGVWPERALGLCEATQSSG